MSPLSGPQRIDTATEIDEREVARYAREAASAFEDAAAASGLIEDWFEIAGQRIRLRLAGDALAGYAFPALTHRRLERPPECADLTIRVFDTASTGIPIPRPVWPDSAYQRSSEIAGLGGDRFLAAFNIGTGIFDLLDTSEGEAVHWIADAADHPPFEAVSPFRQVLHWWLRGRGLQFLHGAAVGDENGGLLLPGKGGAGKSTSALACVVHGMRYAGDNYVVAGLHPQPTVFNLYQTATITVENLSRRFPHLEDTIGGYTGAAGRDKAILHLAGAYPDRIAHDLPIRAIVIPKIADVTTPRFHRADERQALTALVPSVVRQLTAVRQRDTDVMVELARNVPAFVVELGPDVDRIPEVLRDLLAKV